MNSKLFNWDSFHEKRFEELCVHIARYKFKDANFNTYLKQGNSQSGIDIISGIQEDGKYICIQCKREKKKYTTTDIDNILQEFQKGDLFSNTSKFILATTVDFQKKVIKKYIEEIEQKFQQEYNILIEWWDITEIETTLKYLHGIVSYYFGKEIADINCFQPLKLPPNISPVCIDNYIERTIRIFDGESDLDILFWGKDNAVSLKEVIAKQELNGLKICLLADAHQGKSFLIKHTAYELFNSEKKIKPLVIDIKDYNVQPIENILTILYGEWKQIPFYDLVIFIDGLDEVSSNKFDEMTRHINEFSIKYYSIKIIFSCRQVFFDRYNVASIVPSFTIYELMPLHHQSISNFINQKLKSKAEKFENEIETLGLSSLLYHPFFLINLINKFKKNINQMPKSKQEAFDNVIDDSYKEIYNRRLREGMPLSNQSKLFKSVVQKFAITLQLLGTNSLSNDDGQTLFNLDELQLLEHNSLITFKYNQWSFVNAFFQENLAALALSKMSFDEICKHISVGNKIKKIKIKWLQTVSSLLSLLQPNSTLLNDVMTFIKQDNIELLFAAEKAKFPQSERFEILKELIEKIVNSETGLMHTRVEKIAFFIDGDENAELYLLQKLCNDSINDRIKYTIACIIRLLKLSDATKLKIVDCVLPEINKTNALYYAKTLVEIINNNNLGTRKIIDVLLGVERLISKHEFRNSIYDLIIQCNCVNEYYQFGLDGINNLIEYETDISHYGAEFSLEKLWLTTNSNNNLLKLFSLIRQENWEQYYQRHNGSKQSFIQSLVEKLITLYKSNKLDIKIAILIIELIKNEERRANNELTKLLCNFFIETNLQKFALRLVLEDIINKKIWDLSLLITEESFDYISFEIEQIEPFEKYISGFKNCITVLRYQNKGELADKFYNISMLATEGHIFDNRPDYQDEYLKLEEIKHKNDLRYIQSKEAFIDGLNQYFYSYGKKEILEDDIYVDEDSITLRKQTASNFIFWFLMFRMPRRKITLRKCIEEISKQDFFNFFRASEILTHTLHDNPNEIVFKKILQGYYATEIFNTNFVNCVTKEGSSIYIKNKEKLISEIFEKFQFETPKEKLIEMVWMDMSGIKSFKESWVHNTTKSISKLILERLDENGKEEFAEQILKNIQLGINYENVLATHISLCVHLQIDDALDVILDLIKANNFSYSNVYDYVDAYLELGGDTNKLIPLFNVFTKYNDYTYIHYVEKLYIAHPNEVITSLIKCLNFFETTLDNKIQAAKYLSVLKSNDGFLFLTQFIRTHHKSPFFIQGSFAIHNIDTAFALEEIEDITYFLIDTSFETSHHHDSAKNILIEWINAFASKSEEDLNLVCNFIYKQKEKLSTQYETASDLAWYAERVVENFRNSDNTQVNINSVKKVLSELNL